MRRLSGLSAFIAVLTVSCGTGQAAIVVDTLPYENVPQWTDVVFSGTAMVLEDTDPDRPGYESTKLITETNRGVWFGWASYGDYSLNQPAWGMGSSVQGNYLRLDAQFGPSSADWSTYFFDETYNAAIAYGPTIGCNDLVANTTGCYGLPRAEGILLGLAEDNDPKSPRSVFVPLDLHQTHTYEVLLKNGFVTYHVNGELMAAGRAFKSERGLAIAVIGDGSGSTLTGEGFMRVSRAVWDNAPAFDTLPDQARANIGDFTNPAGTTIEVAGRLQNAFGATFINRGAVSILGGGYFENLAGGTFGNEATVFGIPLSQILNQGQMSNAAGATFSNGGSFLGAAGSVFANAGTYENLAGGTLGLSGTFLGIAGSQFLNRGNMKIEAGGVFSNAGTFGNEATVFGIPLSQILNQGQMSNAAGATFSNGGSFRGAAGSVFTNAGVYENLVGGAFGLGGTVLGIAGSQLLNRGNLDVESGGVLSNAGMFSNDGVTRLRSGGTILGLGGAHLVNSGLFQTDAGSQFSNSGTFRNLFGGMAMLGGKTINYSPNTIDNQGEMHVSGSLTNAATGVMHNSGLLVIETGGSLVNEGLVNNSGQVTNAGTVELAVGSNWTGSGSFVQSAGLTRVDGLMEGGDLRFDGGRVTGTGTLRSAALVIIGAGAVLGGVAGVPLIDADLALSGVLEFTSPASFLAMGPHALGLLAGSEIRITLSGLPAAGDDFLLVDAGSVSGLELVTLHVDGGGALGFALENRSGDLYLNALAPVPEPSGLALAGAGLALLWWRRGRPGRVSRQPG
jgi:hypothetical protein